MTIQEKSAEVDSLLGIITKLKGGGETKTSQTSQTAISDAGVNELINNILAGPGGVKEIGAATKRAGVYNSTVQEAALNDLYSSAAVKSELARSPTTVTGTQEVTGGAGIMDLALSIGGASLMKSLFADEAASAGAGALAKGGAETGATLLAGGGAPVVDAVGTMVGGIGVDAASQVAAAGSGVTLGTVPAAANLSGTAVSSGGGAALAEGGSGLLTGSNMLSGGLSVLSGLTMGRDASKEPTTLLASAGTGALFGGPVGAAIGVVGTLLGGQLAGSGSFSPMKGIKTGLKSIGKIFGF